MKQSAYISRHANNSQKVRRRLEHQNCHSEIVHVGNVSLIVVASCLRLLASIRLEYLKSPVHQYIYLYGG